MREREGEAGNKTPQHSRGAGGRGASKRGVNRAVAGYTSIAIREEKNSSTAAEYAGRGAS